MITTKSKTVTFVHNGDYSGNISIVGGPENVERQILPVVGERYTFTLPFEEMRNLVLDYLRRNEVRNIEEMSHDEYAEYLT